MRFPSVTLAVVLGAAALSMASPASAESLSAMRAQLKSLRTTINYATRLAARDRRIIRERRAWVPLSPHVDILDPKPDIRAHRQHLKLMLWISKRTRARYAALHRRYRASLLPPHYRQWLCIHSHEGAWDDDGAPYWGGVQFGYNEWKRYGEPYTGVPYANLATPLQQMWAAERYWRSGAGFSPWPNTARYCGLL